MHSIYQPEEDSYLMQKILEEYIEDKEIKVLEIGVGSGIQLKTLKKLKIQNIFGVDINQEAVKHCKKLGFNCKRSNLFSKVKEKYNLVIFNPPYLPEDKREPKESKTVTTGGKNGSEIINKFLKEAKKYLTPEGKIFLLVSSLTKKINFKGYKKKIIAKKKIFFEELFIYELTISSKTSLSS